MNVPTNRDIALDILDDKTYLRVLVSQVSIVYTMYRVSKGLVKRMVRK
jgi:hypothetical protein